MQKNHLDYKKELLEKRAALVVRKTKLTQDVVATGVNTIQLRRAKSNGVIGNKMLERRTNLGIELVEIDKKLAEVNAELSIIWNEEDRHGQHLMAVLRGIFNEEQMSRIVDEANRRKRGEIATDIHITTTDSGVTLEQLRRVKKLCREVIDSMIGARNALTDIMIEGMKKYGKEEFSRLMLPVNKLIPPVAELHKMKREKNV